MSSLASVLSKARVVVCIGGGGAGKTTIAAAVAMWLASRGEKVALITIDPAKRLAEALGIEQLSGQPHEVSPQVLAAAGVTVLREHGMGTQGAGAEQSEGQLWAMTLDVKGTFDEVIERLAPSEQTSAQILSNPVYAALSSAIAGSQEYTAIAKLYELQHMSSYEAIVLDTPPSRDALSFLEAPGRLRRLLEDPTFASLASPSHHLARIARVAANAMRSLTGSAMLSDLIAFSELVIRMADSFQERAEAVESLLHDRSTKFLLVSRPDERSIREALYLASKLKDAGIHSCTAVMNRVHTLDPPYERADEMTAQLLASMRPELAAKVAAAHASIQLLARRDADSMRRLEEAFAGKRPACLRDEAEGLDDLQALGAACAQLFWSEGETP